MSQDNSLNELGYGMKNFIATETSLNSNFGELSYRGGIIDTDNITTLADYMRNKMREKKDDSYLEFNNDEKLMKTYVVPITLKDGTKLDIIVNSRGQDLAQVYVDENGENRFHLDDSVREKIEMMVRSGNGNPKDYVREFLPANLEEFSKKLSEGELIPRTTEEVNRREEQYDQNKEKEQSKEDDKKQEEKDKKHDEVEERTPEQVAAEVGVPLTDLQKFCKENNIDILSIKGSVKFDEKERLEEKMEKKLDVSDGEDIYALRIAGIDGKTNDTIGLMGQGGKTLDMTGKYDNVLEKLVPEGYTGSLDRADEILAKDKIKISNPRTGKEQEYEIDSNKKGDTEYFTDRLRKLKETLEKSISIIESDDSLGMVDRARMEADLRADAYARLCVVERETDVNASTVRENMLGEAVYAEKKAEKLEVENVVTLGYANRTEEHGFPEFPEYPGQRY